MTVKEELTKELLKKIEKYAEEQKVEEEIVLSAVIPLLSREFSKNSIDEIIESF